MTPDTLEQESDEANGTNKKTTFSSCYMCTSDCPTTVVSDGDEIISVSHPDCIRATAMVEQRESENRLIHAQIRNTASDDWRQLDYDDAIGDLAQKLTTIREQHGPEAVAFVVGYTKEARPYIRRLANSFGTPHYISESSCCFGATYVGAELTLGSDYSYFFQASRFKQPETECRVIWSNNPSESFIPYDRHHLFTEADKVPAIVVDPRRTKLAESAAIHLQLRPGTDGALALGIAHVIIEEGLEDTEFLSTHAEGYEAYKAYVSEFTPERTSDITGVPAALIIEAAKLYGSSKPAQLTVSQASMVQQSNGLQNHRAVILLAALTGNLDVAGGNRPFDHRLKASNVTLPQGSSRPDGQPMGSEKFPLFSEIYTEGQAMMLADYIEQGRIKAVVSFGANVMMWPNSNRLAAALKSLQLFSVCDFFASPTTELATTFLPAATHLERQSLITALNGRVQYRPAAVAPRGQAHGDTELVFKLADALSLSDQFWSGDIKASYEERLSSTGLSFADLPENGKSISLNLADIPEKNYQEVGFKTPSGKVEFDSSRLRAEGHDGLPLYREPYWSPQGSPDIARDYPLVLSAGIRSKTYTHSQGRQLDVLRAWESEPRAQIHPEDAAERGIADGDAMEISSPHGRIKVMAWVTDTILKGVVHAPHGWAKANCNALIPDGEALDPVTGYPPFKASLCQVTQT